MEKLTDNDLVISGIGIISAIGQGKRNFCNALMAGESKFDFMVREGRQKDSFFLGAEISTIQLPKIITEKMSRSLSLSNQTALIVLEEAWNDANLSRINPERIGLIVGGSNLQQREMLNCITKYGGRECYIPPSFGFSFFDTDICGTCCEMYNINGFSHTIGGASASGQLAVIEGMEAVRAGRVDVCIVIGALMDLSHIELHAFKTLGAMGSENFSNYPTHSCRPFDSKSDGFIFGESCGAIVIEKRKHSVSRNMYCYAKLSSSAVYISRNRNPNPSFEGECNVISAALRKAEIIAEEIDYVNPHGSGSIIGDQTEVNALKACNLSRAHINTTKSLIGHGLSSAGIVELISTIVQMEKNCLHPSKNLQNPIATGLNWVLEKNQPCQINSALNLSFGFGGINSAICVQKENRSS